MKKGIINFIFTAFIFLFCSTLASCELTISPNSFITGSNASININFPSYSNYLYVYSANDVENPIETISLECEEECSEETNFNYDFDSYLVGKYFLKMLAGGEWVKTDFEIASTETPSYSSDIIILKENRFHEFLWEPNSEINQEDYTWFIDHQEATNALTKNYNESFDFVIFFPQVPSENSNERLHIDAEGIGMNKAYYDPINEIIYKNYPKNLKSLIIMDEYAMYSASLISEDKNFLKTNLASRLNTLYHEIAHHWGINIKGVSSSIDEDILGSHWPNNLNLFNLSLNYIDPLQYYSWGFDEKDKLTCVEGNNLIKNISDIKYSNLTLYLMGLIPAESVPQIYVYNFEKTNNEYTNSWGPSCEENIPFLNITQITIQDIIKRNGERVPNYLESQKDFKIAFVVLIPHNQEAIPEFINYLKDFEKIFVASWSKVVTMDSSINFLGETFSQNCTPKSCSELGKTCGELDDGCGTIINCGECPTIPETPVPSNPSCIAGGNFVWWNANICCSKRANLFGFCEGNNPLCSDKDTFVWWNANACCSKQIEWWGGCKE